MSGKFPFWILTSALQAAATVVVVLAVAGIGAGFWYGRSTGAFVRASDVQFADPATAVREARQLIENFRASAEAKERPQSFNPEQLPKSLRLPKLRQAHVFHDHINLVLGRNPDWSVGARVWSTDTATAHADEPTAYPDIFFFQYCNDVPISPQNLP